MIDMNKQYTCNGKPVRILCTDRNVPSKPVVAMTEDGNVEFYTAEGKWFLSDDCMNDLVEVLEPKFEIGQIIVNTKFSNLSPITIESYYMSNERKEISYKSKGQVWYESECEVWEPKEGEWCYFWTEESRVIVAKFEKIVGHECTYEIEDGGWFKHCAPFIGELPEVFKGLHNGTI